VYKSPVQLMYFIPRYVYSRFALLTVIQLAVILHYNCRVYVLMWYPLPLMIRAVTYRSYRTLNALVIVWY